MGASEALTDTSSLYDVGNVEFSDTYTMLTVTNALASVQNRVFGDKAKVMHPVISFFALFLVLRRSMRNVPVSPCIGGTEHRCYQG
ncbi:unnamed protein product [Brassica rapa subsp. narinosa]